MIRVVLLLFLFSCSSILSYSQNNYKEAYIITLENDTVHGYANFRSDALNLSECLFKKNLEDKTVNTYRSTDILGYGFKEERKIYISQKININEIDQQVFLEYLVKGESASLFYYEYRELQEYEYADRQIFIIKDIYGDFNVVSKKDDQLVDGLKIKKDVSFRNRLFSILGYNAEMEPILKKTDFSRRSMTHAIQKYNDITCGTPDACVVYKAPSKIYLKLRYAFYAGARNVKLKGYFPAYTMNKSQINPEIGAQFILSYPRISNSLSFVVDISASQLEQKFEHSMYERYNGKLSATLFDIGFGIKYIYPKGRLRPGVGLGAGKSYFFSRKLETIQPNVNFNTFLQDSYLEFYSNLSLDYILKNNHSIFFQFNYSTDFEYLFFPNTQQDKYTLSMKVGYKF